MWTAHRVARMLGVAIAVVALFSLASVPVETGEPAKPKFSVKIKDEKPTVVEIEDATPIDPTRRINFSLQPNLFTNVSTLQGQPLHLSHFPNFMINGQLYQQGQGGRYEAVNAPLKNVPGGRQRVGTMTVWVVNNLRITQTAELHPSKSKGLGQKRLMNNVLISYAVENKGAQSATFGLKLYMDTYVIDNDGCMFASPVTHPGKILDGVLLQDKTLPPYLQMLQRPDLKNPGYIAHLSLNMGGRLEKANKLVLSRHGAGFGAWDMPVLASMGDSGISLYWPIKELKAGAKREMGYAYGEGIAVSSQNEGHYEMALGGSFEPGKIFTISAVVIDPPPGHTLSLELPAGMAIMEGKLVQSVAPLTDEQEYSTVLWKARVTEPGEYPIRIRSSTGVTQTKIVTITAAK